MADHEFDAVIEEGRGGGAFVVVPFDPKALYGSARLKIQATFDGHPYRGSINPMGGRPLLGILKSIRAAIGKDIGDTVHVTVSRDTAPREVVVPPALVEALAREPDASAFFDSLSFTRRKEIAAAIAGAKKEETRARRLEKAMDDLRNRRKPS